MKKNLFFALTLLLLSSLSLLNKDLSNAQITCQLDDCTCLQLNSTSSVVLKGRIVDTGGDPNIRAWFEWRRRKDFSFNQTLLQSLYVSYVPFEFSHQLTNLQPCTTYEYRAVAQNSAGTNRGDLVCFRTSCVMPITVSCSASPNPAQIHQTVTFTAHVSGGQAPYSYSWSGACSGSNTNTCSTSFSSLGQFTAYVTVTDVFGNSKSASCSVNVQAGLPRVITLPPVETL